MLMCIARLVSSLHLFIAPLEDLLSVWKLISGPFGLECEIFILKCGYSEIQLLPLPHQRIVKHIAKSNFNFSRP